MDLIVTATPGETQGRALLGEIAFDCALGRAGIRLTKREGDGATPAGKFPFRRVLFRQDRTAHPLTRLEVAPIRELDGWCDDPAHPVYNRMVRLPIDASHERLWRDDHVYDIVLVIGHNDAPVVAGKGSAVFVHLARAGFLPTEGCVAFMESDLRRILKGASTMDHIDIRLA